MEGQLSEANTFPSQSFSQSFLRRLPTDNRFLQCTLHKAQSTGAIDAQTLTFNLAKFNTPNVYMIQDAQLELRILIVKADGSLPERTKLVAPRNNVLHTMFQACRLYLNDKLVSLNSTDYHYKSYISTCISYCLGAKVTHLQAPGWYTDSADNFNEAKVNNAGFMERNRLFRIDNNEQEPYASDGAVFRGRIFHELVSCESGLPPSTSVQIDLDKAPAKFVLQADTADTEQYEIRVLHALLFVPIAALSFSVFSELSNYMARTSSDGAEKAVAVINFRRLEIRGVNIPPGNMTYQTKALLSDRENPSKMIICFVESTAKAGSYHHNPYEFRMSWKVKKKMQRLLQQQQQEMAKKHLRKGLSI